MRVVLTPKFRSLLKKLGKTYRKANYDVGKLIDELETGARPGVRLQGVGGREVYKVRLPNTSASIGKSGGFRVQYFVGTESITLFLIWSKTQVDDMPLALTLQALEQEIFD